MLPQAALPVVSVRKTARPAIGGILVAGLLLGGIVQALSLQASVLIAVPLLLISVYLASACLNSYERDNRGIDTDCHCEEYEITRMEVS
ncbi:MAG: hypothetical protein ABEI52_07365, partial [Halobacteriaceae archaeon]